MRDRSEESRSNETKGKVDRVRLVCPILYVNVDRDWWREQVISTRDFPINLSAAHAAH